MKDNYKFNKTVFWEEKFLTEEGGGKINKAVKLNSPGLFEFFEEMENNNEEITGLRFNEDKVLEVLVRTKE